jgi:uncharacterized phage protein (TIGR02218 family)
MNRADYVAMYTKLTQTRTNYAECIKVTRVDGNIQRFTSHDRDLSIRETDGSYYDYKTADSFQITALENQIGLVVSNMDIDAILSDESISEADIIAGLYNQANVEIFISYWTNSEINILPLRTSWIGELQLDGTKFKADLRGIAQKLAQVFIHTTSLECRWSFGDSRCGIDKATFTEVYTVTEVNGQGEFVANIPGIEQNLYTWGLATWVTGNNAGVSMEIINNYTTRVQLFLPMPYEIEVGDTVSLLQGCGKGYSVCNERYDNIRRFGGEPFLTGSDFLASYPQTFSEAPPDPEDEEA